MKRQNKKLMTMMLAGALCAATIGGVAKVDVAPASAAAVTYALSEVFTANSVSMKADDSKVTAFEFSDDGVITMKRNLAFKWYEGKDMAKYFTVKFAFKDLDFKSVSFEVESESAWATKDEKTKNTVTFTNGDEGMTVQVNEQDAVPVSVTAGEDLTLSLGAALDDEGKEIDGAFSVNLTIGEAAAEAIGEFENVGSNWSKYTKDEMHPLVIKADVAEGEKTADVKTTMLLKEINGQKFDTTVEGESKVVVTDTAAPVLVVNEKIGSLLLGTAFSVEYEKIDVLQTSSYSETKEYYQYNPTVKEAKYQSLTTSVYFMDTVYYVNNAGEVSAEAKEGYTATSVYLEEAKLNDEGMGREFVSIKITLGDKAFTASEGEWGKKEYDLSWYASEVETKDEKDYIVVDRNKDGAFYTHLTEGKDENNKLTNVVNPLTEKQYKNSLHEFEDAIEEAAKEVYAGSGSYLYIPSVKWLINDNNGYRNLKFTISYKTPSSDTAKTSSSLSYNGLRISTTEEGMYEFRIFANDKAGNTMKYYLDGELVDVTTSNIWDIEGIPSFQFKINNLGLKMSDEDSTSTSSKKTTEDVGEKYTMSSLSVVGATSLQEDYRLYKIDTEKATAIQLTDTVLTGVTYKTIRERLEANWNKLEGKDYFKLYKQTYAALLAEKLDGVTAEQVEDCFIEIDEFNSLIDEEKHPDAWKKSDNKYNWSAASKSFTAAEEGRYLILADYWEEELPQQRVSAYKLIVVDSKVDEIDGEKDSWIKNNMVSVILFAIAGVMLILIIILLLIKPSDETMEDIDEKAEKKTSKKKKENE